MIYGMILWWPGALEDIPPGFSLCDGTNGTPDLRDRMIVGAGGAYNPGDVGGADSHNHDYTGDGHYHDLVVTSDVMPNSSQWRERANVTMTTPGVGTTDLEDGRPKYLAAYPIMYTGL